MEKFIKIKDKIVGKKSVFIVAELSANHNGRLEIALDTIKAAADSGADAVKLQTYTEDSLTVNSKRKEFLIDSGIWKGKYLYDLFKDAKTPYKWHERLFEFAYKNNIICFSSPFDKNAVDFLEKLNTPAYKIASFEITDTPFINYVASKGKPVLISTGIANEKEIENALSACLEAGNREIVLLKCTSSYPSALDDLNLKSIQYLSKKYNVITGLSDHSIGSLAPIVATSYGAKIIEKHFILDRNLGGPDASFSMTPNEFSKMVENVRNTEKVIGDGVYKLTESQEKSRIYRRSIYVVKDLKKNQKISEDNIRSIRPGLGLPPKYMKQIIGLKVKKDIKKNTPFSIDFVDENLLDPKTL